MTKLTIVNADDPASLVPSGHLFAGTEYVPLSEEELAVVTQEIKDDLARGFSKLLLIKEYAAWRSSPKYKSWDDYCKQEFEISGSMGYKKAAAGRTNQALIAAGLSPVKERVARVITDLPVDKAVEVATKAAELEETQALVGLADRYHKKGKITARLMEKARAEVVPESPHPVDAPLEPPLPPRTRKREQQPIETLITPYDIRPDPGCTGLSMRFEINGQKFHCFLRACEWRKFYPEMF